MMWPQVRHIHDSAIFHQDVYFNMWRLEWVAHALATSTKSTTTLRVRDQDPVTLMMYTSRS